MASSPLLLVQTGTPHDDVRHPHGDFPSWFSRAMGGAVETEGVRVFEGKSLPPPDANRIAVITGSWAMVTDRLPWSEATAQWIRDAMTIDMPLFGVCYGHQLMAHALGGRVDYHPRGREVGCRRITLSPAAADDALVGTLPPTFMAHLMHEQSIVELPPGAHALAASDHDAYQIVRYGANALSVQFHPEFTPAITETCIRRRTDTLLAEGMHPEELVRNLQDTHEAQSLLAQFVQRATLERV
ncbi:glutamine amidotransferase [Candidatus Burkholderia verschuerenii]|uniref:glutamine amidotransferase n=1 Tax=Candidatus Burkholderia verschuerenii TaxID=242163 RepID=UPI00067B931F|nr:glutamine amidotransferase [Candidatus Burkholderia verschuerenii]